MSVANVSVDGDRFVIKCEQFDNERVKSIPLIKWSRIYKQWQVAVDFRSAKAIKTYYKDDEIDDLARAKIKEMYDDRPTVSEWPEDFAFKSPPMAHQLTALKKSFPLEHYALFMDMGVGKSFTAINLAAARYEADQISSLLVVCPTSIKPVWIEEFEKFCPVEHVIRVHEAGKRNARLTDAFIDEPISGLRVLAIGVESLSQGGAWELAERFCKVNRPMMVIDESSTIKTPPKSKGGHYVKSRTYRCWELGMMSKFRMIMTGTPVTQGIHDLFAQYYFLNWDILGNKNYYSFRNSYCVMGGFEKKKIIGYKDVGELLDKVKPYTYSVKITDVMDMPEQVYEPRYCTPSVEQKRILKDLGDPYDMSSDLNGKTISCETVLERMIRYQQVVGGFFPYEVIGEDSTVSYDVERIPGPNPKMVELINVIGELDETKKVVIWARFRPEQELIYETLTELGHKAVIYEGTTGDKTEQLDAFRNSDARFFVSGGRGYRGITIIEAYTNIYYSNTFSYDDREQSERRTWRKGQKNTTVYVDLTMQHKIDKQILRALRSKEDVAKFVDRELSSMKLPNHD